MKQLRLGIVIALLVVAAAAFGFRPVVAQTTTAMDPSASIDPLGDLPTTDPSSSGNIIGVVSDAPPQYLIAKITMDPVVEEHETDGVHVTIRTYRATLQDSSGAGREITFKQNSLFLTNRALEVRRGDLVVVAQSLNSDGTIKYDLIDQYRIPALLWAAAAFFLLALIFGRLRGVTSVLGMLVSAGVIIWFVVPQIVAGADPLWTSLFGSILIVTVSLFLAHGFNKRTGVAFLGTIITLVLSAYLAVGTVSFTHLFGIGTEENLYVLSGLPGISLRGLLLAGIMLGLLGVLDDITTAQSAVIEELKRANADLHFWDLYRRGLSVGREHIASLINTLFLAYAGVALPLFLLFSMNHGTPLWQVFNNELIAEEIVRTLVGSACLILAVPITTILAAYFFQKPILTVETERW